MSKKEEFNQLELLDELLDELCNDEIEQYMSITSRGDGKSFNNISAYMKGKKHV